MYYSSESSDSDAGLDVKSLDLSYLMLDSSSLSVYLKNSAREQQTTDHTNEDLPTQQTTNVRPKNSPPKCLSKSEDSDAALNLVMKQLSSEASPLLNVSSAANNSQELASHTHNCISVCVSSSLPQRSRTSSESSDSGSTVMRDNITEKLFLNHNQIVTLPFEILLYQKLRFLDLSNNNIDHVNDYILHLPELQTLYLKNNQLSNDGLPKDLSVLKKIKEINLSGNQLTVIPPQLFELSSLCYLYLGNNRIEEVRPEIKALQNLQVLHLGGNDLTLVPEELGDLSKLAALVLANNKLRRLPRAISRLTNLKSLLLHTNNLCCLPVEIVTLRGLNELSLRDNPLVTRFVNSCAKELMYNPPSLKELCARVIKQKKVPYTEKSIPRSLLQYLTSGHKCVNPKCKGVYFTSCVEHIKFVDFCGMYRVPLMHYLCSSRCTSQTPSYYRSNRNDTSDSEEDNASMRKVLLG